MHPALTTEARPRAEPGLSVGRGLQVQNKNPAIVLRGSLITFASDYAGAQGGGCLTVSSYHTSCLSLVHDPPSIFAHHGPSNTVGQRSTTVARLNIQPWEFHHAARAMSTQSDNGTQESQLLFGRHLLQALAPFRIDIFIHLPFSFRHFS